MRHLPGSLICAALLHALAWTSCGAQVRVKVGNTVQHATRLVADLDGTLYLHYGDTAVLKETLPAMIKWVDFVYSISNGPIPRPPRPWGSRGFTFGDWLQPKGPS